MKHLRILRRRGLAALAALLTVVGGLTSAAAQEYRTFTNSKGRAVEAYILSKSADSVTLQVKGRTQPFVTKLNTLSKEDQDYIKNWDGAKALFLQKCRTLTVRDLLELRG